MFNVLMFFYLPRVTPPERPQFLLATDVPDQKLGAFRLATGASNLLAIEANRRHCVQVLVEFQSVQCGGLAGRVQSEHHNVKSSL